MGGCPKCGYFESRKCAYCGQWYGYGDVQETAWSMFKRIEELENNPYDFAELLTQKTNIGQNLSFAEIFFLFIQEYTEQEAIKIMKEIEKEMK